VRNIVLDAGAFIAAERRDRRLAALLSAAEKVGGTVLLPTPVIAEIWRDPPRQCSVQLMGTADDVISLDLGHACAVGELLGKSPKSQLVDASVATVALEYRPSIVLTSDPDDLERLLKALGATCSFDPAKKPQSDVIIAPI
jgi:hypothetical protein